MHPGISAALNIADSCLPRRTFQVSIFIRKNKSASMGVHLTLRKPWRDPRESLTFMVEPKANDGYAITGVATFSAPTRASDGDSVQPHFGARKYRENASHFNRRVALWLRFTLSSSKKPLYIKGKMVAPTGVEPVSQP
jgi:hypothetical protein